MTASPTIVLVRHATTAHTRAGRFSGHEPTPLDAPGRLQADRLAERLRPWTFGQVLVSPVARARETADRAGLGTQADVVDALAEWRYGDLVGRPGPEVRAENPGWELWTDGAPGGESPTDIESRLQPVLTRLRAASDDVAIVSHGHLLRALIVAWLGLPIAQAGALAVDPASVTVLGHQHGRPALLALNDRSHLLDPSARERR